MTTVTTRMQHLRLPQTKAALLCPLRLQTQAALLCPLRSPSLSTVTVCSEAERCFRRLKVAQPPSCLKFAETVMLCVTENVMSRRQPIFPELHDHMFDTTPEDNHIIHLVKVVAQEYVKIRLYHWGKQYTSEIVGAKVRKNLSKLILFKHQ